MSILLETSLGDVVVDLYHQLAPIASLNFLKLCAHKYYNDCHFFRVEPNFVARTGDPTNNGTGGRSAFSIVDPDKQPLFKPSLTCLLDHQRKGTVSLTATESPDGELRCGSQFFITLAPNLHYLDGKHVPIGFVAEGLHVLDRVASAYVDRLFVPFRPIRIRHTIVLHDPFDDLPGMLDHYASPEPAQGDDAEYASEDDGLKEEETRRRQGEKYAEEEARSRAEVLEIIGDIGDADLKPPDNVLFICKLNPITKGEDLEIIFSRFGECNADIIVDKETGQSLCYGFIEFDSKLQCEKAYSKMDAALIDDRRVKVDFSQSVSKLWNQIRRQRKIQASKTSHQHIPSEQYTLQTRKPPPTLQRGVATTQHDREQQRQGGMPTQHRLLPKKRKSRFDQMPS